MAKGGGTTRSVNSGNASSSRTRAVDTNGNPIINVERSVMSNGVDGANLYSAMSYMFPGVGFSNAGDKISVTQTGYQLRDIEKTMQDGTSLLKTQFTNSNGVRRLSHKWGSAEITQNPTDGGFDVSSFDESGKLIRSQVVGSLSVAERVARQNIMDSYSRKHRRNSSLFR